MQITSFLPHYQLVCMSFDISSFSLISFIVNRVFFHRNIFSFHHEMCFLLSWNVFPFIVKNYFLSSRNAFPFIKKWHLSEKNGHLSKNNGVFWKNNGHFFKKDGHFWKNLPRFSPINSKARCTFVFLPSTTPESSRFAPFSTRKWANK